MSVIAIIPARMGSTRFPGKPLAEICGIPMIGLVYQKSIESCLVDNAYIATCDQEIKDYADSIGAPCIMTSSQHERCTDRTAEALQAIERQNGKQAEVVVMVQGDEPMITGKIIDDAIKQMKSNGQAEIVNIIAKIDSQSDFENRNTVKAVTAINNHVLYFSREPIPSKKKEHRDSFGYKQTGIILFKRAALLLFNATPPTPLEIMESCDMLRVLENNGAIAVIKSERPFFAVDIPGDIRHVEQALTTITETDLT